MRLGPAIALIAALGAAPLAAEPKDTARLLSDWSLPRDIEGLGGLSGLEISDDGTRLTALSDRGMLFRGTVQRDGDRIASVTFDAGTRLRGGNGNPLLEGLADAEGLGIARDGTLYVSFENLTRVLSYAGTMAKGTRLPDAPAFARMQLNSGPEALAIDDAGRIYVMPERSGHVKRPFPVYRYDGTGWSQAFAIPRHPPYLPVGADFGPDGRLYLLERHFAGLGFASRVRAFEISGSRITAEETVLETPVGAYGNLEGLAVWQDAAGAIRLTMISDDNFIPFQASQIVEFALPLASPAQTH